MLPERNTEEKNRDQTWKSKSEQVLNGCFGFICDVNKLMFFDSILIYSIAV